MKDTDGLQFIDAIMKTIPVPEEGPSGTNSSAQVNGKVNGDASGAPNACCEFPEKERLRNKLEDVISKVVGFRVVVTFESLREIH